MNKSRYTNQNQRRQRTRDSIERRMDQWMETGRQLVDGVAGNRPGQRRKDNNYGLNNMGRWVGEKIDWFFEEEEDWIDPLGFNNDMEESIPIKKRPLTAISLRVPKALSSSTEAIVDSNTTEPWPEDSSFRIQRWERQESQDESLNETTTADLSPRGSVVNRRPLPRSSRRRRT